MEHEKPTPRRRKAEVTASKLRSAVTNGRRLFVDGDGNSAWSRRYRDLIGGHVSDMGGREALSEAQISLIKRTAAIELELEQAEGRLSMGQQIDLDQYTRAAGHLRRLLETLGVERRPRNVTTITEYLRGSATAVAPGAVAAAAAAD